VNIYNSTNLQWLYTVGTYVVNICTYIGVVICILISISIYHLNLDHVISHLIDACIQILLFIITARVLFNADNAHESTIKLSSSKAVCLPVCLQFIWHTLSCMVSLRIDAIKLNTTSQSFRCCYVNRQ